jgi:hypothetical protein
MQKKNFCRIPTPKTEHLNNDIFLEYLDGVELVRAFPLSQHDLKEVVPDFSWYKLPKRGKIYHGRCYEDNFLPFLPVFLTKKLAFFSKSNVMNKIFAKTRSRSD